MLFVKMKSLLLPLNCAHLVGFFSADILTVVGAVIVGYATCMLQQGFGSSFFSRTVCIFPSIGLLKQNTHEFLTF